MKHIQHASPYLFQMLLFQDQTYLVVFFNNEKVVQGLVHRFVVVILNRTQVRLNQW